MSPNPNNPRPAPTSVETLTCEPGSMLEAMFSGRFAIEKDEDGTRPRLGRPCWSGASPARPRLPGGV